MRFCLYAGKTLGHPCNDVVWVFCFNLDHDRHPAWRVKVIEELVKVRPQLLALLRHLAAIEQTLIIAPAEAVNEVVIVLGVLTEQLPQP